LREVRILSPCGILGYGFPRPPPAGARETPGRHRGGRGIDRCGSHKLGSGEGIVSRQAAKRDLLRILTGGHELAIPVIIGSAGGAGARTHVEWSMDVIGEIVREKRLSFETAVIYADVDRDTLHRRLDEKRIAPLGPVPELTHEAIEGAVRIVARWGASRSSMRSTTGRI